MGLGNGLRALQAADEGTKRRWTVISSVIVMVIVIFIWLKYFNTLIAPAGSAAPAEPERAAGFSPWESVKSAAGLVADRTRAIMQSISEALRTPRSYLIKPPQ